MDLDPKERFYRQFQSASAGKSSGLTRQANYLPLTMHCSV